MVEAKDACGLYRSDDFGATWQKLNDSIDLWARPWYYMHIYADPQDEDTVFVLNLGMHKSTDGGKTFVEIPTPHGDNHDLWIDPRNNQRMIEGNDGGACVSFDGGESFSTIYNQMTAQFYHMDVDDEFPYRVYGTQQDNSSVCVPSDTIAGPITWGDCEVVGTGESGYIAVKPDDVNTVYVGAVGSSPGGQGALQKADRRTGQIQLVNVWPEDLHGRGVGEAQVRFPWTFPILFSPHDPNVLYTCGNIAYRSTNGGHSWQAISPDLTRADMRKLGPSGGPITLDTSGAEHYATIYTFRESPHEAGVFWAGSDDGLVHISRDNGASWQNVTPPDLPEWSYIRTVEPSPFDAATWYVAATRYKLDDPAPYLYKTTDSGASWTAITAGHPRRRLRARDPLRPECARHSLRRHGAGSLSLARRRRVVAALAIHPAGGADLRHEDQGRRPDPRHTRARLLDRRQPDAALPGRGAGGGRRGRRQALCTGAHLAHPARPLRRLDAGRGQDLRRGAWLRRHDHARKNETGQISRTFLDAGEGAPRGAVVDYFLPEAPAAETPVTLAILDAAGNVLREYGRKAADYDKWDDKRKSLEPGPWLPLAAGMNRFVWNLRLPGAVKVAGNKTASAVNEGPFVLPGHYQVRLTVGDAEYTQGFEVVNDPRVRTSLTDLAGAADSAVAAHSR